LAKATQIVGKETIKVERLSDQFTVPQKLTIKAIGHIGRQANERLPLVDETPQLDIHAGPDGPRPQLAGTSVRQAV
jgi:hypothetical protein